MSKIEVIDMLGEVVLNHQVNYYPTKVVLDIKNFLPGFYILKIQMENAIFVEELIIK